MAVTKKVRKPKQGKRDLLPLMLQLLAETYPLDRLSPGIVLSYLTETSPKLARLSGRPEGSCYYGSVVRYPQADNKVIVFSATGETVEDVLVKLGSQLERRSALVINFREALNRG
jgi:hypothetical protein